jgi:hypothetical protein
VRAPGVRVCMVACSLQTRVNCISSPCSFAVNNAQVVAALEQVVQSNQDMARSLKQIVRSQELAEQRARREAIERLLIQPQYTPRSSGSGASRSPHPLERLDLKVATIDYYGLWASPDTGDATQSLHHAVSL